MSEREFPVIDWPRPRRAGNLLPIVRSVPWSIVEPIRDRAKRFHDQTLERLAERGGMSPGELWVHLHGIDPSRVKWDALPTPDELRTWLRGLL